MAYPKLELTWVIILRLQVKVGLGCLCKQSPTAALCSNRLKDEGPLSLLLRLPFWCRALRTSAEEASLTILSSKPGPSV